MTVNPNPLPPSALERALAHDRGVIAIALAALVLVAWGYLLVLSRQMSDMSSMASMPGMHDMATGSPQSFALTVLMWWTMMIGMMVPSAAPMILLFGGVQRRQLAAESPTLRVALFSAAYLATWGAFSVLAAAAQVVLTRFALLAPMNLTVTTRVGALFVALAGVYQLTPLKDVCLRRCRSPAEFLSSHWRPGNAGALRMGVDHGAYCVGCCWLLMGLLFVVGVMNLLWVAALTGVVLLEKVGPAGTLISRVAGAGLIAFGIFVIAS